MKPVFYYQVVDRFKKLNTVINRIEKDLINAPQARLRICKSGRRLQYYKVQEKGDTKGTYLRKNEILQIRRIAQADYERKVLSKAKRERHHIKCLLDIYDSGTMESVSDSLSPERLELIDNKFITDEEFVMAWLDQKFTSKEFEEDAPEYYTQNGMRVRSKSEIIISDRYASRGVPQLYELPININGKVFHPDFTLLNVRTREMFIHEHFGMMDDPVYVKNAIEKIMEYRKAGYYIGVNFIVTFETSKHPLDLKELDTLIDRYLL